MASVSTPLPFEAYRGSEPYIFLSYSHKDGEVVYPLLKELHEMGYRVWYDEGIDPGNEWPEEIAKALEQAAYFLVFLTPRAADSRNVRNEINFAINESKPFLAVYLDEFKLPAGLRLRISDIQAILKWRLSGQEYERKLQKTLPDALRGAVVTTSAASAVEPVCCEAPIARSDFDASRKAGDVMTVGLPGKVPLELVWCPPGTFWMGRPEREEHWRIGETRHRVTLTKGFWIGKYPVTQRQWLAVMGDEPSKRFLYRGNGECPAEHMTWDEISKRRRGGCFLSKLNGLGLVGTESFRLPTEAEWEYACRAETTGPYNVDGVALDDLGWYGNNSDVKTHPVGQKRANAWGVHDMHGNVFEWCADLCGFYSKDAVIDPTGPKEGEVMVCRGGSSIMCTDADDCRSDARKCFDPEDCYAFVGFRLALSPGLGS